MATLRSGVLDCPILREVTSLEILFWFSVNWYVPKMKVPQPEALPLLLCQENDKFI
jgi:hypothetical protein